MGVIYQEWTVFAICDEKGEDLTIVGNGKEGLHLEGFFE